ncbi:hypothetical protein EGW08_004064, partial [Elysia chlorotica]
MADLRGESRASGRSQYSESVVLNQDVGDLSAIEQDLGGQSRLANNSKAKSTRFNLSPESEVALESQTNLQRQTYTNMSLQAKLRDRLYDKPEHSGVMNYVRMLSMRKRPISVGDITPDLPMPVKRSTVLDPLPTTIPKKKAMHMQYASKSMTGMSVREQNVLQNIVTRKRPNQLEPLDTCRDTGSTSSGGTEFDELDYDDGLKMQEADLMTDLFSPTSYSETVSPTKTDPSSVVKRATGANNAETKSRGGQSNSRLTTTQFLEEEEDDDKADATFDVQDSSKDEETNAENQGGQKTQDNRPIQSDPKQFQIVESDVDHSSPLPKPSERSKSAGVDTRRSADSKKTKLTVKSQSTSHVSSKADPTKVLSYLKKNKYDDRVPENTSAYDQVIAMREALGWVTEIPRHGPDTREKMEKLKDIPENEKKAKEDTGEFFYCLPRNRNNLRSRYNPYDLQICYETDEKMNESNATPALWWLWERRMFYMVFQYPVFDNSEPLTQFTVRFSHHPRTKLYRCLFMANEVLQGCLIHVRNLCESARSLVKDGDPSSIISLVELDPTVTMTLQDFETLQKGRCDRAFDQLTVLREKVIEVVWESCAVTTQISFKYIAENKPLYAEIAEWRKVLARLSCFLRTVDYMLQDLLRHLVYSAAQRLLDHL